MPDAPALHVHPGDWESERDALGRLYDTLMAVRWNSQVHPTLNPYHAAKVLLKGWQTFRAEYVADLDFAARFDPWIAGRVDGSMMALRTAQELELMAIRHVQRRTGKRFDLRGIVDVYERYWRPPAPPVPLSKATFTLTERGPGAGHIDAFRSSGMERTGTLHELAEDLADPRQRAMEHEIIDREIEAETTGKETV